MALLDAGRALLDEVLVRPMPDVQDLLKLRDKARRGHEQWKPSWARSLAYLQGRQFIVIDANTKKVAELETREFGAKPRWQSRTVRNRIQGYIAAEISQATSRVPGYEVIPSTSDPADINASKLAAKVLLHFYDFLSMRRHLVDAYYYAVNCGEGFVRPYWNPKAGEPIPSLDEMDEPMFEGELALRTYGPHQVYWEPGLRFEDARTHFIDVTMSVDQVKALPGYVGEDVKPDAQGHSDLVGAQTANVSRNPDMVIVTEALTLPDESLPEGRRLFIANNRVICTPEPYPCVIQGPDGPEPVLHKLVYFPTPDRDRDMGLTEHLIDPQAMLNLAINKSADWVNYAMNPQWVTGPGGLRDRRTTQPGAVFRSKTSAEDVKPIQVPTMPSALMEIARMAVDDMEEISSQRGVPAGLESAKALQSLIERDNIRRAFITQNLADFHARLGRHVLYYIQKHYDAPRLLALRGRDSVDYIPDFKGSSLRSQISVRVSTGSIEPVTREAVEQKVRYYAQMGWISPQQAMAAIENGLAEDVNEVYDLNVAKQERELDSMKALADEVDAEGDIPDASEFDMHAVHRERIHRYQLTTDYEQLHPAIKDAIQTHDRMHAWFEQQQAIAEAQQQQAMAQGLGMANAAKPQGPAPMPDQKQIGPGAE